MIHHKILKYVLLLIGVAFLAWFTFEVIEKKEPLNQFDAYVFTDNGMIHYFEINSRYGKVNGKLHELTLVEVSGTPPFIKEEEYRIKGKKTGKGYEFKVNMRGENISFDAYFTGPHLSVKKQGEKDRILYNPVDREELETYVDALLVYYEEEKEKNSRKKFFDDLKSIYGYMYSSEDGSYHLLLKIDEALQHGGEITGSLLMLTSAGDKNKPYQESKFVWNGITDGKIIELFTIVDGKEIKLEGSFLDSTASFDLSFWMNDEKIVFNEVSEKEFMRIYLGF
jgi:hypothetical protein